MLEVLIAETGRRYELTCNLETRLGGIQSALEQLTGVKIGDQILICGGTKLDANRTIGSYATTNDTKTGGRNDGESSDTDESSLKGDYGSTTVKTVSINGVNIDARRGNTVGDQESEETFLLPRLFLFNRASLRSENVDADTDDPSDADVTSSTYTTIPLPVQTPSKPPAPTSHPLDSCPSVLLRNLPTYEREFRHHLRVGQALWDATQQRQALAWRLLDEMKVQAMSLDEARANVEVHYKYVSAAHGEFMREFHLHRHIYSALLASLPSTLDTISKFHLHPRLARQGRSTLGDCIDLQYIEETATSCKHHHEQFISDVTSLASTYRALQINVEELYMSSPAVDIGQLENDFAGASGSALVEEEASLLESFSQDLAKVQSIVEDTVAQMSSEDRSHFAIESAGIVCEALEKMNAAHVDTQLPRIVECDTELNEFNLKLFNAKRLMTRCVHTQLRSVSSLQSKIRDLKLKHAIFRETMSKHSNLFAELKGPRHAATAYEACLAEVMRREAYRFTHATRAEKIAETMARMRAHEIEKRATFEGYHGRYLPRDLWEDLGLTIPVPQCDVTVPQILKEGDEIDDDQDAEDDRLYMKVTLEDLKKVHDTLLERSEIYQDVDLINAKAQDDVTRLKISTEKINVADQSDAQRDSSTIDGSNESEKVYHLIPTLGNDDSGLIKNQMSAEVSEDYSFENEALFQNLSNDEPLDVENIRLRAELAGGLAHIAILNGQLQSLKSATTKGSVMPNTNERTQRAVLKALDAQKKLSEKLTVEIRQRDSQEDELRGRIQELERALQSVSKISE